MGVAALPSVPTLLLSVGLPSPVEGMVEQVHLDDDWGLFLHGLGPETQRLQLLGPLVQ